MWFPNAAPRKIHQIYIVFAKKKLYPILLFSFFYQVRPSHMLHIKITGLTRFDLEIFARNVDTFIMEYTWHTCRWGYSYVISKNMAEIAERVPEKNELQNRVFHI